MSISDLTGEQMLRERMLERAFQHHPSVIGLVDMPAVIRTASMFTDWVLSGTLPPALEVEGHVNPMLGVNGAGNLENQLQEVSPLQVRSVLRFSRDDLADVEFNKALPGNPRGGRIDHISSSVVGCGSATTVEAAGAVSNGAPADAAPTQDERL